jgi:hypothetical protein
LELALTEGRERTSIEGMKLADRPSKGLERKEVPMTKTRVRLMAPLAGLVLATSLITACGTVGGAAVGAGSGAAIGAGTGYGAGKGALIGTGVGAAAGAVYDIMKKN